MKRFAQMVVVAVTIMAMLAVFVPVSQAGNPIRVMVQFVPGQKDAVMGALQRAGGNVHYEFDNLDTIAVSLPEQALDGIRHNPNVVMIEEDSPRYLMGGQVVPFGIDMVQARDVWDVNRDGVVDAGAPTGAGITLCIIDSGFYTGHEDLPASKVLGGYPSNWNTDGCGHGSHVAGTIAASNNSVGVVGVNPGTVSLYIVKVFGDDCSWTYASGVIDAANKCAANGAKIISMSLGGSTKSLTEERGFQALYDQGVLSIAAAGNDGTTALSYPASYASVVSIAAIDENKVVADFSQKNSAVTLAAPGVAVLSTVPWLATDAMTVDGVNYTVHHVENAAYGTKTAALVSGGLCDATNAAWAGKTVLCQRGTISFYDKVMNVQNSGGAAAIIYNNVDGEIIATLGDGYSSTIPAVTMTKAEGEFLVANKLGVSANLVTTVQKPASGYEAWNGTSMATPHASGVAALVWSSNPSKTNVQIRQALIDSALDLGTAGKDNSYGYGLIQAKAAIDLLNAGGGGGGGDTTAPVISNVASKIINKRGGFQITWTTNEAADSKVVINGQTFTNATMVTSHSMSFTGTRGATYTYYIYSTDAAGNTSTAGPFTHRN